MSASTKKTYQGKYLNDLTIEIVKAAEILLKYRPGSLTIVQGGYNRGGVSASSGTHDGGGALDLTASDYEKKVEVFRKLGCAAWYRPALRGVWGAHVHLIVDGDSTASAGAKAQVVQYRNRKNGLANYGADQGYQMSVFPKFVYGAVQQRWVAVRDVQGYSQPVINKKYAKSGNVRKKGWVWANPNIATVSVNGEHWLVTSSKTFYKRSEFVKYENINVVKENVIYEVTADPSLYGLASPGSGNEKIVTAKKGAKVTSVGYTKLSNGEVWVKNTAGNWFSRKYLKVRSTPEPEPIKPTTLRIMSYNLPGEDKLGDAGKRVLRASLLIKSADPDVIGFNELIGPVKDGASASKFASDVLQGLGTDYAMLTPTTAYNENYVFYKKSAVSVVKQYPDEKIYAKVGTTTISGRHLTPVVFKSNSTGLMFVFGVTHLISNNPEGAQAQASLIGKALKVVAMKHGNAPVILAGDMNTALDLSGLVAEGMVNTRRVAKATTDTKYATYTNYSKTRPSTNTSTWTIDQIWVPKDWTVNGYTHVLDTNILGFFKNPRPSDHLPVIVSVTK